MDCTAKMFTPCIFVDGTYICDYINSTDSSLVLMDIVGKKAMPWSEHPVVSFLYNNLMLDQILIGVAGAIVINMVSSSISKMTSHLENRILVVLSNKALTSEEIYELINQTGETVGYANLDKAVELLQRKGYVRRVRGYHSQSLYISTE